MSTQTKRGLIKPDRDENYSIEVFNDNCDKIEEILDSVTTITIPADTGSNYTTLTDKDGVDFYNIQIPVTGMTADFVGTQPLTPKMIDPSDTTNFSIAEWENVRDNYMPLILGCFGRAGGYVDIYLYDKPDIDFLVNLYGV